MDELQKDDYHLIHSNASSNDSIDKHREAIDRIDDKILSLLNERLVYASQIGKIKSQQSRQVFDSSRESMILKRLSDSNKGPLKNDSLKIIFTEIIAAARQIQNPLKISYFGQEAAFTHIAAMSYFGRSSLFLPQAGIREIFEEVEKGNCHYGVVPVENSIEGAVNHTLDLLFESDLKICAETYLPISHNILNKSGKLSDIKIVYSHPQPLAQCRKWLRKNLPDALLKECSSTAYAAQLASESSDLAAIASTEAAKIYNLEIASSKIEDHSRNATRFLIIGRDDMKKTGSDKTSFMFVTAHIPGALYQVLEPIARSGINMVKLESRPTKHENWSYFFIVDIEGHIDDTHVKETIAKMKNLCLHLKWLGSYPKAKEI